MSRFAEIFRWKSPVAYFGHSSTEDDVIPYGDKAFFIPTGAVVVVLTESVTLLQSCYHGTPTSHTAESLTMTRSGTKILGVSIPVGTLTPADACGRDLKYLRSDMASEVRLSSSG